MTGGRVGERGLSIMEAIIVVTITALLALLILPLLPRAASGSVRVAERGIDTLDQMRAEREFRVLVRSVAPREVDEEPVKLIAGNASALLMQPSLAAPTSCARQGAPAVRLSIESQALVCASEGRRRVLLRWTADRVGVLSYSADGATWRSNWDVAAPPFVRFELRRGARVETVWTEQALGGVS